MLTSAEIRRKYIDFFVQRGHRLIPSAPLVPPDDPTLLFTSAGMVQFKPLYSMDGDPPYGRAVSVQKCLRVGGKASDLENVGRTLRHHTFFEMLGNFSFGDYFKKEAIAWAWEFCIDPQWLGLPPERIFPTVFGKPGPDGKMDVDEEALGFWKSETGVMNPVIILDEKENFWGPAGDTGACGPCSEIKFFMGTDDELRAYRDAANTEEGFARLTRDNVELGDLFLEIWNLVFPQFDQQLDGSRPPLRNRGIDTGAGLERVTTAVQMHQSGGKIGSPYETDHIFSLVTEVATRAGLPYPKLRHDEPTEKKLRDLGHDPAQVRLAANACADHARALVFALAEGIVPSNEDRGYVIRKILRRAARFGKKLGIGEPFLWRLVEPVVETMGSVYPELKEHPEQIRKTIRLEEERFSRTLNLGSEMLDEVLAGLAGGDVLPGAEAYRLYDTYGFPLDLTIEVAEERGIMVDQAGYEKALAEGRARARSAWSGGGGVDLREFSRDLAEAGRTTQFEGFTSCESEGEVIALFREGKRIDSLDEGQVGMVVLDRTSFYGEGGGQIGDRGLLKSTGGAPVFNVEDTQKTDDGFVFHYGEALDRIAVGDRLKTAVDETRRADTMRNHSATHLLQGALKQVLGKHVTQKGSYVGPDYLRFDFTNPEAVPEEKLREIESIVNRKIRENHPVTTKVMPLEEAKATGAIAPFGEKYGHSVRVVQMSPFSTEFCGGTHVNSTGDIGQFVITGESSVASGIRRIEAKTGEGAAREVAESRRVLNRLSRALAVAPDQLEERVAALQNEVKELKRESERARTQQLASKSQELDVVDIGTAKACVGWIEGADAAGLRSAFDRLRDKHQGEPFVAVLGSGENGKATLIVGATDEVKGTPLEAGHLIRAIAPLFEGRGGGKPTFAQAGGKDAARLKAVLEGGEALAAVKERA